MMTRRVRKKKVRLPASRVSGTERTLKMKLERKEQPSDLEAIPFRTRKERLAAVKHSLRFWKRYFKQVNEIFPGLHMRFTRFGAEAGDDLRALACLGANPFIIINILYTDVWYEERCESGRLKAGLLSSSQEIRRLSSTDYWVNGKARLEGANKFLSSLMSHMWVGLAVRGHSGGEQDNPFVRVSRDAADSKERVEKLLNTIEELGLCREGWMWRPELDGVKLVQTGRRGVKKSGRGKAGEKGLHWGICATELHHYLRSRAGRPHWDTIARLLHFAGFSKDFPLVIPPDRVRSGRDSDLLDERWLYKDRIKKRVKALWRLQETRYSVTASLSDYEQYYEVNPDIPEGPVRTRLVQW